MSDFGTEMNHRDFSITVKSDAPDGYPTEQNEDIFSTESISPDYGTRKKLFVEHILSNPSPNNFKASFYELVRIDQEKVVHDGILHAALDYIDQRKDCSDFIIQSILRILYFYKQSPVLKPATVERCKKTVLNFKYWPSEPGIDDLCTWTENHQILFSAAGYLAGQLYPDDVFTNSGETGRQKMEICKNRIMRWMDLRFRSGFSEWLSHVYYDEDQAALLSLIDMAEDDEIKSRAVIIMDVMLLDMALHNFKGVFASTHGRSYENGKKYADQEATSDTQKLLFGKGKWSAVDNMSAICFALSKRYEMPDILYEIANDRDNAEILIRQKMGILLKEANKWGLKFNNFEDGMIWLSMEAYTHPKTINLFVNMMNDFRWWENEYYKPFKEYDWLIKPLKALGLMPLLARIIEKDATRNLREAANIVTYRTPDYQLSAATDYRKGYGGDQQHIWQATLGPDAVCFTTHPAKRVGQSPNYWVGSGTLPRVAQVKNVLISVHKISSAFGLYHTNKLFYTHAWLPQKHFDEIEETGGWIFARKGNGYLALRARNGHCWVETSSYDKPEEVISEGKENIWICEMGREAINGTFRDFIETICNAPLEWKGSSVTFESPSQGKLSFGWNGSFTQNGTIVKLSHYDRYETPYGCEEYDADVIEMEFMGKKLLLDWKENIRFHA